MSLYSSPFYVCFGDPHGLYNRIRMLLILFDPLNYLSYLIVRVGESSKARDVRLPDTFMMVQLGSATAVSCPLTRKSTISLKYSPLD